MEDLKHNFWYAKEHFNDLLVHTKLMIRTL